MKRIVLMLVAVASVALANVMTDKAPAYVMCGKSGNKLGSGVYASADGAHKSFAIVAKKLGLKATDYTVHVGNECPVVQNQNSSDYCLCDVKRRQSCAAAGDRKILEEIKKDNGRSEQVMFVASCPLPTDRKLYSLWNSRRERLLTVTDLSLLPTVIRNKNLSHYYVSEGTSYPSERETSFDLCNAQGDKVGESSNMATVKTRADAVGMKGYHIAKAGQCGAIKAKQQKLTAAQKR